MNCPLGCDYFQIFIYFAIYMGFYCCFQTIFSKKPLRRSGIPSKRGCNCLYKFLNLLLCVYFIRVYFFMFIQFPINFCYLRIIDYALYRFLSMLQTFWIQTYIHPTFSTLFDKGQIVSFYSSIVPLWIKWINLLINTK